MARVTGGPSRGHACSLVALLCACSTPARVRLLLVDVDADPHGLGGNPGALFEIDPAARAATLLASSREFTDPVDVLADRDGSLLVLDLCGLGGEGRILRVSADGRDVERVALPTALVDPTAFARAPDGSIWVCDRGESFPLAQAPGPGALFRFAADLSRVDVLASGAPLEVPSDLCFAGGRAFVLDADAFRREIAELSEGGLFALDAAGGPLETVARLPLVSPLSLAPFDWRIAGGSLKPESFLITDVNADADERTRLRGAVYSWDRVGGTSRFARDDAWRDPSCGTIFDGALLVVDGSADPLGLGDDPVGRGFAGRGRGGVWRVDLATREVVLFCASREFVNPVRLRCVP